MFVPKHFQIKDQQESIDFIKRYSFGTLVTTEDALPIATHIPFTFSRMVSRFSSDHILPWLTIR